MAPKLLYLADLVHRDTGRRFTVVRPVPFGLLCADENGVGFVFNPLWQAPRVSPFRVERSAAMPEAAIS